jgi:hypothetical protein
VEAVTPSECEGKEMRCPECFDGSKWTPREEHPKVRKGQPQTGCLWDHWRCPNGSLGMGDEGKRCAEHDADIHRELAEAREELKASRLNIIGYEHKAENPTPDEAAECECWWCALRSKGRPAICSARTTRPAISAGARVGPATSLTNRASKMPGIEIVPWVVPGDPATRCARSVCRHARSDHGAQSKEGTVYGSVCRRCSGVEAPDGDTYPRCARFKEPAGTKAR